MFQKHRFARQRATTIIVGIATITFAACGGRDTPPPRASAQHATRDSVESGGDVSAQDTTARPVDAVWITDANALAILGVLNARQIAAADIELEAWHTDTVRTFAALVARDHAAMQRSVDSLAARIHIAPVMSALALRIDSAFRLRVDSLRAVNGVALERAFTHEQVVAEQAIAAYADQLAGAATAPEVEALMESVGNRARAQAARARSFEAARIIADSVKAAATADSIAKAEERHRRSRPPNGE